MNGRACIFLTRERNGTLGRLMYTTMKLSKALLVPAIFVACFAVSIPSFTFAATPSIFEVTGWIPYWRAATGTADTIPHLNELTEVNPFVYTLKSDGTIADNG